MSPVQFIEIDRHDFIINFFIMAEWQITHQLLAQERARLSDPRPFPLHSHSQSLSPSKMEQQRSPHHHYPHPRIRRLALSPLHVAISLRTDDGRLWWYRRSYEVDRLSVRLIRAHLMSLRQYGQRPQVNGEEAIDRCAEDACWVQLLHQCTGPSSTAVTDADGWKSVLSPEFDPVRVLATIDRKQVVRLPVLAKPWRGLQTWHRKVLGTDCVELRRSATDAVTALGTAAAESAPL